MIDCSRAVSADREREIEIKEERDQKNLQNQFLSQLQVCQLETSTLGGTSVIAAALQSLLRLNVNIFEMVLSSAKMMVS